MPGEVARSGVKHPGPRARVAPKPTPATRTILYWGLVFLAYFLLHLEILEFLMFLASTPVGNYPLFKQVRVWVRLRLGVASALVGPLAWQGLSGPSQVIAQSRILCR